MKYLLLVNLVVLIYVLNQVGTEASLVVQW